MGAEQQPSQKSSTGLDANIAGLICYLIGPLGIIFFVIEKDSKFVKFHGMQSFILSVALIVIFTILGIIPVLGWIVAALLSVVVFVLWIFLMYKAFSGEMYKLPYIGDLAEKQVNK
jgi:uncharacterized membrane protein